MRILSSRRWRIFLIAWLVYAVHFATNVVREHYPAFAIAERGTFRVDEYQGFHPDIFVHTDGHSYINNQVFTSILAAIPLFLFDPVLDALEAHRLRQVAAGATPAEYRIDKPMRRDFFRLVQERGLDLRFGAATALTSVLLMAPASALFLVGFYSVLRRRYVAPSEATELTWLLGFGTAIFFRTSTLNHNLFVMYALFVAFACLWVWRGDGAAVSVPRRALAGVAAGVTLAVDYIGLVTLPLVFAYVVMVQRASGASWSATARHLLPVVAGSLPPIGLLLLTQWSMFGHPLLPAQFWMPDQNVHATVGVRGLSWPSPDMVGRNLFDPAFGLFTWCPALVLAMLPPPPATAGSVLPSLERRWVFGALAAILLFSSANQYARLQWNSGFRYLLPIVPFLVLALADRWRGLSRRLRGVVLLVGVGHAWVLTVFREPVGRSWRMLLEEGPQLPWYRVLTLTSDPSHPWLGTWWVPGLLLSMLAAIVAWVWRVGARFEARLAAEG